MLIRHIWVGVGALINVIKICQIKLISLILKLEQKE